MTEENLGESLREDASSQVLYDQLQSEYNKLLKQYAAAENTIDELRTGATVHLYTEPLESRPNSRLSFETARYPQNINFPRPLQASTSEFSTMNDTCSTNFTTGGRVKTPTQGGNNGENLSLQARIQALKEDVNTVESLLSESGVNNEETLNELLVICTQLYKEHGKLTRDLKLQSRNTVSLSGSSDANIFSTKTELQKELHRIGLRIEEIQGDIMAGLKTKKPAVVQSQKPGNDGKPLRSDLESLVKEMKDLKDASIKNSEEVLNSSRMENTKKINVLPHERYSEPRHDVVDSRYFTASPVNMDYPANTLSASDRSENGDEQTFNMTWPPSRHVTDSDIGVLRHSFSETPQGYDQSIPDKIKTRRSAPTNHSMSSPYGQSLQNTDQARTDNSKPSYYSKKEQSKQFQSDQHRSELETSEHERRDSLNSANIRKQSPPYSEEETAHHRSEPNRSDPRSSKRDRGDYLNSGNIRERSPFSSQETVLYKSDSTRSDRERNRHFNSANTRQHSPYSDQEDINKKRLSKHLDQERKECLDSKNTREHSPYSDQEDINKKRLSKHLDQERKGCIDSKNTREHSPYSDQETVHHKGNTTQLPKHTENRSPEHCIGSPELIARNFNSMSSLADSSRLSTPLFQPRGATRVSPHSTRESHAPRYKRRSPSDGFDSGFVGSEASRSSRPTTDRPDGVQKLNISSQWDSSLRLDLVSEIDENEATSTPEQISTTYELTAEDGRQSPTKGTKSRQLREDVKFINSSPSPPSSAKRSPRTPTRYFEYRTSHTRLPSNGSNSLPVHNTGDPLSSHINERPLSQRRSSSGHESSIEETSRTRKDRRRIRRGGTRDVSPQVTADIRSSGDTVRPSRRTNKHNDERKLQTLRNELDSLHDHVNTLQHPRVTMDMYDELRDHDEQLRRAHERRHERKLDELRETIEQLKKDIKSRNRKERKPDRDTEFYDDFRSELRKVTDRLDELTAFRNTSERSLGFRNTHTPPSETLSTDHSPHDENMAKRFSNLVQKVDELRLRIENPRDNVDAARETSKRFCRLCDEADVHHHSNHATDHQPRTSTPFVSEVHQGREPTAKVYHRSYQSSTYPGAILQQSPVIHHIHTHHKGPGLKHQYETDSDDDVKRTPRHKRGLHRSRYRSTHDFSYNDHLSLDEARKAAWDVQRLSKNILNTITLDLTSLKS